MSRNSVVVPARQAPKPGGIGFWESILGSLKVYKFGLLLWRVHHNFVRGEMYAIKWQLPLCVYSVWISDKATVWVRQGKPESICVAKQEHEEKTSTCHMHCVREKLLKFIVLLNTYVAIFST